MLGTNHALKKRAHLAALFATVAVAFVLGVAGCTQTTAGTGSAAGSAATAEKGSAAAVAEDGQILVTVKVDSSAADGSVSFDQEVAVDEGATAYDALVATGLSVNASDSEYGMYVEGIDGLAAGDHGDMSGWMFDINGEMAEESCDKIELADGDTVNWIYSTGEEFE